MNRLPSLLVALLLLVAPALTAAKDRGPVTDDRIHDQVLMKLAGDQDVKGGGIDVEVKDGMVTLRGRVEKDQQKSKAEKLVKKVKGVTGVNNQLVVGPPEVAATSSSFEHEARYFFSMNACPGNFLTSA